MKVELQIQSTESGHLTLGTDSVGVVFDMGLKKLAAASVFLVTLHVGRRLTPTVNTYKENSVAVDGFWHLVHCKT